MPDTAAAFRTQEARNQANRAAAIDIAATTHVVSGEIEVKGKGLVSAFVQFPIKFIEKPLGGIGTPELVTSWDEDNFPTVQACNLRWELDENPPVQVFYTGVTLGLTITGSPTQLLYVPWTYTGTGFVNPSATVNSIDQAV
jgi:hypothetical protein